MHYVITEIKDNGTRTTIRGYNTMQEAINAAKELYESEHRLLRYVVDQVREKPLFGESIVEIQNVWDSEEVLPWE